MKTEQDVTVIIKDYSTVECARLDERERLPSEVLQYCLPLFVARE